MAKHLLEALEALLVRLVLQPAEWLVQSLQAALRALEGWPWTLVGPPAP